MSGLFNIPISGLKKGWQSFDFKIGNDFFDLFEESEIREGVLRVSVAADKRSSYIEITILIDGTVKISCDRCLGIFSFPVHCENTLLVQFGTARDESDPDMITIPAGEHELDLKQYFYDYINLALPIQRYHPVDKDGNSTCDQKMLSILNEHIVNNDIGNDTLRDELRKIMNN